MWLYCSSMNARMEVLSTILKRDIWPYWLVRLWRGSCLNRPMSAIFSIMTMGSLDMYISVRIASAGRPFSWKKSKAVTNTFMIRGQIACSLIRSR